MKVLSTPLALKPGKSVSSMHGLLAFFLGIKLEVLTMGHQVDTVLLVLSFDLFWISF